MESSATSSQNTTLASPNTEQKQITERLRNLTLEIPKANASSSLTQKIKGKSFAVVANELKVKSLSFSFAKDTCMLNVSAESGEHRITCGINHWLDKMNQYASKVYQLPGRVDIPASETASATWMNDNTLLVTERFTDTTW